MPNATKFMKWGMQAFDTFKVVPPGIGIVHQVNLEYLARGVHHKDGVYYPDYSGGNRLATRRWSTASAWSRGVSAASKPKPACSDSPCTYSPPTSSACELDRPAEAKASPRPTWCLPSPRCCATPRSSASSSNSSASAPRRWRCPDRATIGNMAPEYGATMGFFGIDDKTDRLSGQGHRAHGGRGSMPSRPTTSAQEPVRHAHVPARSTTRRTLDARSGHGRIQASLAGPKRPQDRIELGKPEGVQFNVAVLQIDRGQRLQSAGGLSSASAIRPSVPNGIDHRQRRRAHRGDHLLHQHVEPGRVARGGTAREKSRRGGA